MSECRHTNVFTFDSMPPVRKCLVCGMSLPLTAQQKADYEEYTGKAWVEPGPPLEYGVDWWAADDPNRPT